MSQDEVWETRILIGGVAQSFDIDHQRRAGMGEELDLTGVDVRVGSDKGRGIETLGDLDRNRIAFRRSRC